ncbi:transcriptional regulator [Brevibacillus reuszeri]|uniref:helix-turn-helix domain-containing protein n=1 Tax=Brevibacillus reuszeri TaxID=54915 RepID=UPI001AFE32E3|nr:helix-turn-helix domain-containing protein [Brevibacillus reuszeri]GIO07263.1 transcriptional regulator [Brevibacillus reuszeri]
MAVDNQRSDLGTIIKSLLKERSLSMRKLSTLTGIDTATISRIVNGKQQAKPDHLQQFANHLQVPLARLLKAAGFEVELESANTRTDMHSSIDTIQEVLASSNFFDHSFTTEMVKAELAKYEIYALTVEGRRIIQEDFFAKVDQVSGAGPFIEQLRDMYEQYSKADASDEIRAVLGSALLYFILSADIIPDYIFPIGYVDDAIAVQLVLNRLVEMQKEQQS